MANCTQCGNPMYEGQWAVCSYCRRRQPRKHPPLTRCCCGKSFRANTPHVHRVPGAPNSASPQRQALVDLLQGGASQSDIARLLGISRQRVHQIVRDYRSPANSAAGQRLRRYKNKNAAASGPESADG